MENSMHRNISLARVNSEVTKWFFRKHVRCVNMSFISTSIKGGSSSMTSFLSVRTVRRRRLNRRSWNGHKALCVALRPGCRYRCGWFTSRTRINSRFLGRNKKSLERNYWYVTGVPLHHWLLSPEDFSFRYICGNEEIENSDGIHDDCKFWMINDKNIPSDFKSGNHDRFLRLDLIYD